jgi:preprotein translocase subunit SecG
LDAVITVLHVIACVFLVAVVLLQRGRGAQVGAVFGGGGGGTMFGGRGAGNFLTKLTTGSAIVFMLTSLSLSYLDLTGSGERLFEGEAIEEEAEQPSPFEEFGTAPAETPEPGTAQTPEPGTAP